ncbi:internal scaffolding protein [Microviridae sp.]|nr:internal scaffolding protein [Microviridae sp.]
MFRITSPAKPLRYEAGEMLTEQSHARSTDINFIIDQFTRTGVLKHSEQYAGQYGEFLAGDIYEIAQTKIAEANTMFQTLPPGVRQEFQGGTQEFLEFINDPTNVDQIEELGLDTSHLQQTKPTPRPTPTPAVETASDELTEALSTTPETE